MDYHETALHSANHIWSEAPKTMVDCHFDEDTKIERKSRFPNENFTRKSGSENSFELKKEKHATLEWIFYFQLRAPLFPVEAIDEKMGWHHIKDFESKFRACVWFCREDTEEVAKMFSIDRRKLLKYRIEAISTILAFFNKLSIYARDLNVHKEEDALMQRKLYESEELYMKEQVAKGLGVVSLSPNGRNYQYLLHLRHVRRSSMKTEIDSGRPSCVNDYVRKLVTCFPKQGKSIQNHLRRTGFYPTDYDIAGALRGAIERGPETEWIFRGLPSNAKLDAKMRKEIEDSWVRAAPLYLGGKNLSRRDAIKFMEKFLTDARIAAEEARRKAETPPSGDSPPSANSADMPFLSETK